MDNERLRVLNKQMADRLEVVERRIDMLEEEKQQQPGDGDGSFGIGRHNKVPKDLEVHDWGELRKWEEIISFYEKLVLGLDYGQARYALVRPMEPQEGGTGWLTTSPSR